MKNNIDYSKIGGWLLIILLLNILHLLRSIPVIVFLALPSSVMDIPRTPFLHAALILAPLWIFAILSIVFLVRRKRTLFFASTMLVCALNIVSGYILGFLDSSEALLQSIMNNVAAIIALILYNRRSVRAAVYFSLDERQ